MIIPAEEYGEFYAGYIKLSNGLPLDDQLTAQKNEIEVIYSSLSDEDALFRYEKNKWSLKEVLGHLIDTERIFCYRALAIARGEQNPLSGYDQDAYVENAGFNLISLNDLTDQYKTSRTGTLQLFSGLDEQVMQRKGVVNNITFSVRALGYVVAGHEHHHLNILAERYFPGLE